MRDLHWTDAEHFFPEESERGKRVDGDYYPTPLADIAALRDLLDDHCTIGLGAKILEPSAGDGRIAHMLRRAYAGSEITAVELNEAHRTDLLRRAHDVRCPADFRAFARTATPHYGLIAGNPPYSMAFRFIRECYDLLAPGGVLAFLLPLSILASQERCSWMKVHPPWGLSVRATRPKFLWGGSAPVDYAWVVWHNGGRYEDPQWIEVR